MVDYQGQDGGLPNNLRFDQFDLRFLKQKIVAKVATSVDSVATSVGLVI